MGAKWCVYLSKYGSSKVSRIVLISSVVPYMLKTDDNPDGVPQEMFDEFKMKLKEDRPAFLETFGKQFYGVSMISHPVSSAFLQWSQMLTLMASPKATQECMVFLFTHRFPGRANQYYSACLNHSW